MNPTITNLWPVETECSICGKTHCMKDFLPMWEGEIVSTERDGQWAGMPVCENCYERYKDENNR